MTTETTTIKGKILEAEMEKRDPYEYQWLDGEHKDVFLRIVLMDESGVKFYFKTPAAREFVAFAVDTAVVGYIVENGAAQWLQKVGDKGTATKGSPNNNHLVPLCKIGDEVTVRGRLTKKVSKWGTPYGVLTHVKRI